MKNLTTQVGDIGNDEPLKKIMGLPSCHGVYWESTTNLNCEQIFHSIPTEIYLLICFIVARHMAKTNLNLEVCICFQLVSLSKSRAAFPTTVLHSVGQKKIHINVYGKSLADSCCGNELITFNGRTEKDYITSFS